MTEMGYTEVVYPVTSLGITRLLSSADDRFETEDYLKARLNDELSRAASQRNMLLGPVKFSIRDSWDGTSALAIASAVENVYPDHAEAVLSTLYRYPQSPPHEIRMVEQTDNVVYFQKYRGEQNFSEMHVTPPGFIGGES